MSDTATAPEFVRVEGMDQAPACFSPGWIPDVEVFPELQHALAENQRLRAVWDTAAERRRELEARIEAGAEQRQAALRDAILHGEQEPQAQAEDAALSAELAEAKERAQAAVAAFVEHVNKTIALVVEHGQEWQDAIDSYNASVQAEIEAVEAKARELRGRFGNFGRLQHWIHRTGVEGAQMPSAHFPFADIPAPLTGNPKDEQARLAEFFERSYAGGVGPQRRASAAEARSLEEGVMTAPSQEPTPSGEVDLRHVEDDDLTDWLLGCGMFDGDPRPSAETVVKAAEGDPAMAERLLAAERAANPEAPRQEVVDQLTEITKGKAGA